jgi:hypothetical protein
MTNWFRPGPYALTPIADTSAAFADFTPYVPAVNDRGVVAFQAAVRDGGSGVFAGSGEAIAAVVELPAGEYREVISHPDIDDLGSVCLYASSRESRREAIRVDDGRITVIAHDAGPLGPTMSSNGSVACRVDLGSGRAAILAMHGGFLTEIAATAAVFSAFWGLPVINRTGSVVFRADLKAGGQAVCVGDGALLATVAETGAAFTGIGQFPTMNDAGAVAFCATLEGGRSGVYIASAGDIVTVIDGASPYESFRGVLLDNAGRVVFYATPRGGELGVFAGDDPQRDCIVGLGASRFGSSVVDFALNPVSINGAGQIAIRLKLADGRQFIVRADPPG